MATGSAAAKRQAGAPGAKREYTVEALAKGLRVLELFSEQRTSARLSDIATEAGLPLPTAYRIVSTLCSEDFLEHLPDGTYRPAVKVLTLGFSALRGQTLVELADAPLRQLAAATGETVNLGVLLDDKVLYLVRIRNRDLVTANIQVGSMLPAVHSSIGKALLAHLDLADLEKRLGGGGYAMPGGPNAVRSIADLRPQLAAIRDRGYGLQDEEVAQGLRSVSAPIRDADGVVAAAANIAVRSQEWTLSRIEDELAPLIVATAATISQLMGHR